MWTEAKYYFYIKVLIDSECVDIWQQIGNGMFIGEIYWGIPDIRI